MEDPGGADGDQPGSGIHELRNPAAGGRGGQGWLRPRWGAVVGGSGRPAHGAAAHLPADGAAGGIGIGVESGRRRHGGKGWRWRGKLGFLGFHLEVGRAPWKAMMANNH